ncbi:MFS transporter [Pandoraea pulmonicola]|uniref:High-copy suppressor of rspA n=1 Tax=Pandoraea pulmonicola TaxID=93221 RepID=A0AAJ5CZS4_PANPU|nr:MFS transporter [Pandoraea pulmonicola]AJC21432.1 multidrug MFS transporter [Pandoraea pulmonicola]SUA89810.1 High-copy suppressor of rspA [Pandoraea pulmonicola]
MSNTLTDGMPMPARVWAIATVMLAISLSVLDSAIANVALPTIARDLNASPATSIWIVNAYQLAITISLLPLAALGEIVSYRKVYTVGLAVFTLASLACALSDSLVTLTVARVAQGFGAAGIMSVNTALVKAIYPSRWLGRGVALNSLIVAFSSAAGPTVAAGILSIAHWPWLFAINVPLGIVAFAIAVRSLPDSKRASHPFDWTGAVLSALTFGLLISGIDSFGHGQDLWLVAVELVAAVVIGTVFVRRQRTQPVPLLPVDLLRIPIFGLSICTSMASFCAQMLAFVSLPFFLQDTLGFDHVQTGLLMTAWPLTIMVVAPIAGRLLEHYKPGLLGAVGLAAFALGLLALGLLPQHPTTGDIVWRMALCGFGFGLFQSPNNYAMLMSAPAHRSGGASGMLGTARLTGQTTGAALVALVFSVAPQGAGTRASLFIAAAFAAVAAVVSSLRTLPSTQPGARSARG